MLVAHSALASFSYQDLLSIWVFQFFWTNRRETTPKYSQLIKIQLSRKGCSMDMHINYTYFFENGYALFVVLIWHYMISIKNFLWLVTNFIVSSISRCLCEGMKMVDITQFPQKYWIKWLHAYSNFIPSWLAMKAWDFFFAHLVSTCPLTGSQQSEKVAGFCSVSFLNLALQTALDGYFIPGKLLHLKA